MTANAQTVAQWWGIPPTHQVTYLDGADPDLLSIALDPLPDDAPAVVQFRPSASASVGDQVGLLLAELDATARMIYPHWLPGADRFDGSGVLGIPAVRQLALRLASTSRSFGPFLADLAERSAGGRGAATPFPAEVRAAGLARVIAEAYGRRSAALLIVLPAGLASEDEHAVARTAEWFAGRGRFTVWLAGPPLVAVDRIRIVSIRLPETLTRLALESEPGPPHPRSVVTFPPLTGVPRPDSPAELALERALAPHDWAAGREWNRIYRTADLARSYRLDLCWWAERVIVEVDGADHRARLKWADDRARDVHLQMYGFAVLRFPNEDVLADPQLVIRQIHHVLSGRRHGVRIPEMRQHDDR
jgi:very-short-patch-repair endonuclease